MTYQDAVDDNLFIQRGLADFWSNAHGWAPADGAALLASARLDWTPSLAQSLHRWAEPEALDDGDLILAWANLGGIPKDSDSVGLIALDQFGWTARNLLPELH